MFEPITTFNYKQSLSKLASLGLHAGIFLVALVLNAARIPISPNTGKVVQVTQVFIPPKGTSPSTVIVEHPGPPTPAPPIGVNIDVSGVELVFSDDEMSGVFEALKENDGFVGFGLEQDPRYLTHVFRYRDWNRVDGQVRLQRNEFFAVTVKEPAKSAALLSVRTTNGISDAAPVFALFPREYEQKVKKYVAVEAARLGKNGRVVRAVVRFDLSSASGMTVESVLTESVGCI